MLYFHNKINGIKIDMKLNPQLFWIGYQGFSLLKNFSCFIKTKDDNTNVSYWWVLENKLLLQNYENTKQESKSFYKSTSYFKEYE